MVIEQFRFGPHLRGDVNPPWVLEPIAGRIDPGETAEATAIREAQEEAGLTIGTLHHVADYYPSPPGAVSEFLMSYIAIADLPDTAAGLGGGVDHEAEDIRSHVIPPFACLMELVSTGEAGCGPLVLSALWLAQTGIGCAAVLETPPVARPYPCWGGRTDTRGRVKRWT